MAAYLKWGLSDYRESEYSQDQLRNKFIGSRADVVFTNMMGARLMPFVGHIKQIFMPP